MKKKAIFVFFVFLSKLATSQITVSTLVENVSFRSITEKNGRFLVSGSKGNIFIKNEDEWVNISPAGYSGLDFRSSEIINDTTFIAVSSGEADQGQAVVLKTQNSGKTWEKVYESKEKGVFLDAIKISSEGWGYILGDPIDDKPFLLYTNNYGHNWERHHNIALPNILPGEASFAASNSCLQINGNSVWFNTQNRVFTSANKGKSWSVFTSDFEMLPSRGIFGLHFLNQKEGIAVGGDYIDKKTEVLQFTKTNDGGKSWKTDFNIKEIGLSESAAFFSKNILLRASLQGTYISKNRGKSWNKINETPFHAVACSKYSCVLVGGMGKLGIYKP